MSKVSNPKRILVLTKYRFIGDTLLAVPLLREARSLWPHAKITLLTGAPACELTRGCPYIDNTIEFDPYRANDQGWGRLLSVVRQIRRGNYDLALVCNRSFHSALLAFLGGVKERVGWSGFQGRDSMLTQKVSYGSDDPEQKSYLDLLAPFDHNMSPDIKLSLWVSQSERDSVSDKVPDHAKPLIAIQPGASHAEKQWDIENYSQLMARLYSELPEARFVLLGGPNECDPANELISKLSPALLKQTTNLVGDLTLRQTLAVLTISDLFIGGDTAIRHSATALNIPSVALFGPTSVKKWGNASPPSHLVIQAPSRRVMDIAADDVFDASLMAIEKKVEFLELSTV